jgi:hypothetical protein
MRHGAHQSAHTDVNTYAESSDAAILIDKLIATRTHARSRARCERGEPPVYPVRHELKELSGEAA